MENNRYPDDAQAPATEAFDKLLEWIYARGYNAEDPNFKGTALRAAKGFAQLILDPKEVETEIDAMLQKSFPSEYDGMVLCKHNFCVGTCPHHILPVIYRISVAYIPGDAVDSTVLGISKLSRLAWMLARAPVLQEDLTVRLADILYKKIRSKGSAAFVEGLHLCMAARGIESPEARVTTQVLRGAFLEQPETRNEFLELVTRNAPPLIP